MQTTKCAMSRYIGWTVSAGRSVLCLNHECNAVNCYMYIVMFSDRYHHRKVHEGYGDIIREETLAYINVSRSRQRFVQSTITKLPKSWND